MNCGPPQTGNPERKFKALITPTCRQDLPPKTHTERQRQSEAASHIPSRKRSAEAPQQGRNLETRKLFLFFSPPPSSLSLSLSHSLTLPPSLSCVRLQGCYAETGILTDSTLRSQHFIILAVRGCGAQRGREKEKWGMNSCSSVIQLKLRAVRQKEKG